MNTYRECNYILNPIIKEYKQSTPQEQAKVCKLVLENEAVEQVFEMFPDSKIIVFGMKADQTVVAPGIEAANNIISQD